MLTKYIALSPETEPSFLWNEEYELLRDIGLMVRSVLRRTDRENRPCCIEHAFLLAQVLVLMGVSAEAYQVKEPLFHMFCVVKIRGRKYLVDCFPEGFGNWHDKVVIQALSDSGYTVYQSYSELCAQFPHAISLPFIGFIARMEQLLVKNTLLIDAARTRYGLLPAE